MPELLRRKMTEGKTPIKIIEVKNLDFHYGDNHVLQDINLTVEEGTILGIIGPNGGGKSTLMKILVGLLKGYTGEVRISCLRPGEGRKDHHMCIGYVPQHTRSNFRFPATVYDIVEMGLYGMLGLGGPSSSEKDYILKLLEENGVLEIKDRSINALSGGQLQRTLIARALVSKPSVLLLDEPLAGIDETGSIQLMELLLKLKERLGLTVAMVTHDIHSVTMFADKLACLNRSIHFHDNPGHLTREDLTRTFACGYQALKSLTKS